MISSGPVKLLKPHVDFLPVCPEMECGLGCPRYPVRIVQAKKGERRMVQAETNLDVTDRMVRFAHSSLDSLQEIDGFILKERSPSCGMKNVKVYPSMEKTSPLHSRGAGLFAEAAIGRFGDLPMEDEGRLNNYEIREHFLTRIFTLARFRAVKRNRKTPDLIELQERHKFLLMACSQKEMRVLGNLVANREKRPIEEVLSEYERHLHNALKKPPKPGAAANVLTHALGYFKEELDPREKAFFLDALRRYREHRVPLSVPVAILRSWIVRFEQPYLARQHFFEPFPEELVEVTDSGKGRELWR